MARNTKLIKQTINRIMPGFPIAITSIRHSSAVGWRSCAYRRLFVILGGPPYDVLLPLRLAALWSHTDSGVLLCEFVAGLWGLSDVLAMCHVAVCCVFVVGLLRAAHTFGLDPRRGSWYN